MSLLPLLRVTPMSWSSPTPLFLVSLTPFSGPIQSRLWYAHIHRCSHCHVQSDDMNHAGIKRLYKPSCAAAPPLCRIRIEVMLCQKSTALIHSSSERALCTRSMLFDCSKLQHHDDLLCFSIWFYYCLTTTMSCCTITMCCAVCCSVRLFVPLLFQSTCLP